ncbi:hypothetical protein BGX30_011756 [Mortierella sp. GBA39]|nr:hypothetical protein BGX30_011756 [Mortierella sp. GBA39]
MSEELRQIFTEELQRMIDFITDLAEVDPLTGQALLSLMVGTIVLSRSVSDAELSDRLLSTGRQHAKDLIKTSSQS